MIKAYYELVQFPDEIKELNKIRSKARFDCISYSDDVSGGYQGLTNFVNNKGQLIFYKTPCKGFVNTDYKRMAEWSLTGNNLNLSSLYIDDLDFPDMAYRYPNANRFLNNGSPNPLFRFRNDGYLFLINQFFSKVELLIIPDGRNLINSYYQRLIDGSLDDEINELRSKARPYFNYIGL